MKDLEAENGRILQTNADLWDDVHKASWHAAAAHEEVGELKADLDASMRATATLKREMKDLRNAQAEMDQDLIAERKASEKLRQSLRTKDEDLTKAEAKLAENERATAEKDRRLEALSDELEGLQVVATGDSMVLCRVFDDIARKAREFPIFHDEHLDPETAAAVGLAIGDDDCRGNVCRLLNDAPIGAWFCFSWICHVWVLGEIGRDTTSGEGPSGEAPSRTSIIYLLDPSSAPAIMKPSNPTTGITLRQQGTNQSRHLAETKRISRAQRAMAVALALENDRLQADITHQRQPSGPLRGAWRRIVTEGHPNATTRACHRCARCSRLEEGPSQVFKADCLIGESWGFHEKADPIRPLPTNPERTLNHITQTAASDVKNIAHRTTGTGFRAPETSWQGLKLIPKPQSPEQN
ncbi:hypothetical protein NM208_g11653 [Fusarium decemcellulare]|uniref:Uncharacterized protein n=1 Tax=Fusarium decemcellulare TaxID=57161 RepID=A0ACC1RTG7_9HYPO|nr:hypothetical protein NM208_g11653 [Fusarium decemcellulare]